MESLTSSTPLISKPARWIGYVLSVLAVLFMLFDGVIKFVPVAYTSSFESLGLSLDLAAFVGILEMVCLIIYTIPRTSFVGAVLLTGAGTLRPVRAQQFSSRETITSFEREGTPEG